MTARLKLLALVAALMVASGGRGSATKLLHPAARATTANVSGGVPSSVVRVIVGRATNTSSTSPVPLSSTIRDGRPTLRVMNSNDNDDADGSNSGVLRSP